MTKNRILLVDYKSTRRMQIATLLNCHHNCCIEQMETISKDDLEQGAYDIIIVHSGNEPEGGCIENKEWDTGGAKVILFSGGLDELKDFYDGILYVHPDYFKSQGNVQKMLKGELGK